MRALLGVAGGCIVLTLLSYFLTHDGNFHTGIINTAISILAIGAVAWLAVRFGQAQARAELRAGAARPRDPHHHAGRHGRGHCA
jgi:threonine/homoserine/homoserine lactone efflux protein